MSYILDALKKSERDRTLVRGLGFGDAGWRASRDIDWLRWGTIGGVVAIIAAVAIVFVLRNRITPNEISVPEARSAPSVGSVSSAPALSPQANDTTALASAAPAPLIETAARLPTQATLPISSGAETSFLTAMPPEFQQTVPAMTVNIHVYTPEESGRILYINNRSYRRGDEIPGGVKVEEIVPDGVVLQFHGQRFKLARPS